MRPHSLSEVHSSVSVKKNGMFRKLFAYFGPAYLVSVGYMDPGNWATDIAAGSSLGYSLIWVLLLSNLSAILLQTLSARLGLVRQMDLAQVSRTLYPPFINRCLFALAQTAIIAMDLAEVIGVAIGLNLLFGLPLLWGVIVTVLDSILLLFLLNKGIRIMETFIISMLFVIGISFVAQMFIVSPDPEKILLGFIPQTLSGNSLYLAIGIIGATVMPHNLYLHSALVQTRKISKDSKSLREAIRVNFIDTIIALNAAFFVNAAILITAAAAFFSNGLNQVAEINDAHKLLGDIFGQAAPVLFAIALIAAGQSSTITGTLAGQIVMEGHINLRITPWVRRLLTRICAIVPAIFTLIFTGDSNLGELLVFSQVILSIQLGFAIIPLVFVTSDKQKMGEFTIHFFTKVLAWIIVAVIIYLNLRFVFEEILNWYQGSGITWWFVLLVLPSSVGGVFLLIYIFIQPILKKQISEKIISQKTKLPEGFDKKPISNILSLHNVTPNNKAPKSIVGDYQSGTDYKHIAVAVDFSKNDGNAIEQAVKIGGQSAKYSLMHVSEDAASRYAPGIKSNNLESEIDEKMLKHYRKKMNELGFKTVYLMGYGSSVSELSKLINNAEPEFDLVILCAHKHKMFRHIFYGSTVSHLHRKIKTPLLII